MRLEFMDRVKDDETLGKTIFTGEGNVLLRAGTSLTRVYINKLISLGVTYVYLQDDRLEDTEEEDVKLIELKRLTLKNMSKLSKNIYHRNANGYKECIKIAEDLIDYITDLNYVFTNLYDIKTYDNYTNIHCLDTGIMATFMGVYSKKFTGYEIKELGIGALLHDIGKIKISKRIINKPGNLTEEEFDEIKKHPIYGSKILRKNINFSEKEINIVEQHHERVDGKGYPYGLVGSEISDFAKITSICDVYNAIRADRSYRKRIKPNDCYELILSGAGTSFDINMVQVFKNSFAIYPLGICVKLSNGIEGYVIRQNLGFPDRPVIRVLYDSKTRKPIQFYEINLVETLNLIVEDVV